MGKERVYYLLVKPHTDMEHMVGHEQFSYIFLGDTTSGHGSRK